MKRRRRFYYYLFLVLLLCFTFYFHNNPEIVFAQLGNFYYKCDNVTSAMYFYQKAFAKGSFDSIAKNNYVSLLINSPLSIESQKMLVKFAKADVQDEASEKAKLFLTNLRNEINQKFSNNYIAQAPYNRMIMRWNVFPITYSFVNAENVPDYYVEEVRKAFGEWEKYGDISFSEINSEDANIIVDFLSQESKNKFDYGRKYVVAYTVPTTLSSSLDKMEIFFYINSVDGKMFTENQIYNTALHEIFHSLGFMGHCYNENNIMYMAKDVYTMLEDKRASLNNADVATLNLLYSLQPDITNDFTKEGKYLPYVLLGDDDDLISSKFDEAKNYVRNAPSLPGGYIDLAESYVAKEEYDKAIKSLKVALNLAETNDMRYIVYYDLAISYYYLTDYEVALNYVSQAMNYRDNEDVRLLRAEIYLGMKNPEVKNEYLKLIELNPNNPLYVTRLANIYIKESKFLKARNILKTFLQNNPDMKNDKRFSSYGLLLL